MHTLYVESLTHGIKTCVAIGGGKGEQVGTPVEVILSAHV